MWPKVNKELLPMKGHYFLFNAGTAPIQPFLPVYAKQLGFSSVVVGTVYSILPVAGMLAKPFFGAIADRFRLHKFTFLLFQFITIVTYFSIQFIPEMLTDGNSRVPLVCGAETNVHVNVTDVRDDCLIQKFIASENSSDALKCRLECDLTPQFESELCYHWRAKIPQCSSDSSAGNVKNIITEYADVSSKKSKLSDIGKDAYSEKFKSPRMNSSVVGMNAIIFKKHSLLENRILYLRISKTVLDGDDSTYVPSCLQLIDTNCSISCDDPSFSELLTNKEISTSINVLNYYQFWLLLILFIASWVGMAVVTSISDAICFEMLGVKANLYGNQRLWGSIGWGLFALFSGLIVDEISKGQSRKDYRPGFYLMLIMLTGDMACSYTLKYEQTKLSSQILKNIGKLLKNVKVVIFLVWCVFMGMCTGILWNFLFWYIELLGEECETKDWMKTLQGLLSGIQCFLGELPSFFASGWILRKFEHVHVMSGILFLVGVRFLLYSFLTNPWWSLPIEIFQATFGMTYATMASYASIVAPPGTEATVQGLVGAVFEGIGVALGSLIGGIIFQSLGGSTCFRIFGLMAMVACILHSGIQYLLGKTSGFNFNEKGDERTRDEGNSAETSATPDGST